MSKSASRRGECATKRPQSDPGVTDAGGLEELRRRSQENYEPTGVNSQFEVALTARVNITIVLEMNSFRRGSRPLSALCPLASLRSCSGWKEGGLCAAELHGLGVYFLAWAMAAAVKQSALPKVMLCFTLASHQPHRAWHLSAIQLRDAASCATAWTPAGPAADGRVDLSASCREVRSFHFSSVKDFFFFFLLSRGKIFERDETVDGGLDPACADVETKQNSGSGF